MSTDAQDPILVDVFSDVACPWCFIGQRRLRRAVAERGPDEPAVVVRHRAFQLQPDLPPEGEATEEFMTRRFGSVERAREMFGRVVGEGEAEGIAFDFDAMPKFPNTLLAHRAISLAATQGAETAALEALYLAYFSEGLDITDADVIVERLASAGVPDPEAIRAGLAADGGLAEVAADLQLARDLEITGVPLFIADHRYGLSGAQPVETLVEFLSHTQRARQVA